MFRHSRNNLACWLSLSMGSVFLMFAGGMLWLGTRSPASQFSNFPSFNLAFNAFQLYWVAVLSSLGAIGVLSFVFATIATSSATSSATSFAISSPQPTQSQEQSSADAAHELRAPLSAILGNAQVGLLSRSPQEQQQRLENIVSLAKSMNGLLNNLLILARHTEPLSPEQLTRLDLTQHLKTIAAQYTQYTGQYTTLAQSTPASAKQPQWITAFPAAAVWVMANPDLLSQAVYNLLDNAYRYTPADGRIELKLSATDDQAVIQVCDSGIGIAATDLPHIFDRFYRVYPASVAFTDANFEIDRLHLNKDEAIAITTPLSSSRGYGLGLAIVQQIVQAHSGQVTATSTVGQGSTFEIKLPLARSS